MLLRVLVYRMVRIKRLVTLFLASPDILRAFGWRGMFRRVRYVLLMRLGWYEKRYPVIKSTQIEKGFNFLYQFELSEIRSAYQNLPNLESLQLNLEARAAKLLNGNMLYFSHQETQIGWTPRWLENPSTQKQYDATIHWTKIRDLDPEMGDIKYTWEASRFGFVYLLARNFALVSNDKYPQAFWQSLEAWISQNPVNGGPNWRCGQETSLRVMAVLFGLLTFARHSSTSSARLEMVGAFLRNSGIRILSTLDYAMSQRNNHAVSEVVGLWTLAVLFPDWTQSLTWKKMAEQKLTEILDDQFYKDGGYAQHSFNYQRLSMQNLMWLMRIANITKTAVPTGIVEILGRSTRFLLAIQDETTGWLPNYGANDGALIVPLSNLEYRDYRPTLQAVWYLTNQQPLYQDFNVNEESIWFTPHHLSNQTVALDLSDEGLQAYESGYFTTRGVNSFAFWRAAQYLHHRPSQADNLHVDIWINGINLALDPGTYAYNKPFPWNNGLGKTRVHNTANINGQDQMIRLGHFLWSDWCQARVLDHHQDSDLELWLLVTNPLPKSLGFSEQRRAILRFEDCYIVADSISASGVQELSIHWNIAFMDWDKIMTSKALELKNSQFKIMIRSSCDAEFVFKTGAEENDIRGWQSVFYGQKQPCLSIDIMTRQSKTAFFSYFNYLNDQKVFPELEKYMLEYINQTSENRLNLIKKVFNMVKTYDLLG